MFEMNSSCTRIQHVQKSILLDVKTLHLLSKDHLCMCMHKAYEFACLYVVPLDEPVEGLPYSPPEIEGADGVITNLTCVYNYSCPIDIMDNTSCDNFGGIAVLSCVTGIKSKRSS